MRATSEKSLRSSAGQPPAPSRSQTRSLLRKAGAGNVYAYAQAVESYADALSECLYLVGLTGEEERLEEVKAALAACWSRLGGLRHVADFERLLCEQAQARQPYPSFRLEPPHQKLAHLESSERFLLAARLFERWSYKALANAMRLPKRFVGQEVMKLKCRLVGIEPNLLKPDEQVQILRVSEALENRLPQRAARQLDREIARHYHALQFKAQWLSYRCELVDLRQSLRLDEAQKARLKEQLCELLKARPQQPRPRLFQTVERSLFAGRGA